jgi:hypothetical protein
MKEYPSSPDKSLIFHRLATAFRRLGWVAFWIQTVLAFIPICVLLFALFVLKTSPDGTVTLIEVILAYGCLLFLPFSIFWSFRYQKLGQQLASSTRFPSLQQVKRSLRIGIIVNLSGMVIAVLVMMGAVGTMLFRLLTLPAGAIPMLQQSQGISSTALNTNQWIVPLDLVWLQALINTIAAQLLGIVVSLFLLYRVSQVGNNNNSE